MSDIDREFERLMAEEGLAQAHRDREADELLDLLRAAAAESERAAAREEWYLVFAAADGARRTVTWRGTPPRDFRLPLATRPTFITHREPFDQAAAIRTRNYELRQLDHRRRRAYYEERV